MTVPTNMLGIGYTQPRDDARLEAIRVPVPRPGPDQILIHVAASSLNPLDSKLAQLNFFGRTPPVILGFDLAGTVVEVGERVERFQEPARRDAAARQFWASAMSDAMRWADSGRVVPHIGNTIPSTVDAINDGLAAMRAGRGPAGKTAVIVDRAVATP